ncbi:glyoxalase-like domain protein [Capnocytophaga canimorsus]|uniref:Glyoxalase-like domain protein n=2 Tax=Capnocytophaga TaxID=1016 RepID=A0A286NU15_9FLAO|nr:MULTISPECIES: VOC family protein [Capnocytophaga]ATA67644.1 glyoxalase-like domain protein [Capnocytophaga cynodegmi]ATA92398.1 glyoxalase-like domain protein [Capnocytophaga canimorsus]
MKNLISIVEIPTTDFSRAVTFYKALLNIDIEEIDMDGTQMGVLLSENEGVNVSLIKDENVQPSINGTMVYFNAETDLQPILDKVEPNGGKIILPKTEISPEMGFFALFSDTEGNKIGLHSPE